MKKNYKKNMLTVMFIVGFCFMAVGYALLSEQITINGTANFEGNWDIKITNITSKTTGTAANKVEPTGIGTTTATFNVDMYKPGDKIEYTVTLKNNGNIDAIVNEIILTGIDSNDVNYVTEDIEQGNIIPASGTLKFKVIIEYKSTATNLITGTKTLTASIDIIQKDGSNITPVEKVEYTNSESLIDNSVTTGDGLYADSTETGRYIYRGFNPNNYITFNDEEWRIVSIESDGTIKIIKSVSIGDMAWDEKTNRDTSTSTYCTDATYFGCNAWAATSNLSGTPSTFSAGTYSGTVIKDSSINTYLNNTYYNSLGTDKKHISNHNFYVGAPGDHNSEDSLSTIIQNEKEYIWNGAVGLINISDFMKSSTDEVCTSLKTARNECGYHNWLNSFGWSIGADAYSSRDLSFLSLGNSISYQESTITAETKPVVFLSSNVQLTGTGEQGTNSYKIIAS